MAVQLNGFKELNKALEELGGSAARRVGRKSVRAAAKPIRTMAKHKAPKDSGALRRSLTTKVLKFSRSGKVIAAVVGARSKTITVKGKTYRPSLYHHLVESGHRIGSRGKTGEGRSKVKSFIGRVSGTHYMERSLRASSGAATRAMASKMGEEIAKEFTKLVKALMDAQRAIAEVLKTDAAVFERVSDRIYDGVVPSGTTGTIPYIVLEPSAIEIVYYSDSGEANLDNTTVEVMCVALSNQALIGLVKDVRTAVSNYRGRVDLPDAAFFVSSCRIENYDKSVSPRQTGSEKYLHIGTLTLQVWTSEQ